MLGSVSIGWGDLAPVDAQSSRAGMDFGGRDGCDAALALPRLADKAWIVKAHYGRVTACGADDVNTPSEWPAPRKKPQRQAMHSDEQAVLCSSRRKEHRRQCAQLP